MVAPWSRVPAVPAAIGFVAGIWLKGVGWFAWWGAMAVTAIGLLLMIDRRFRYGASGLITIGLGWLVAVQHAPAALSPSLDHRTVMCSGTVESIVDSPDGMRFVLRLDSIEHVPVMDGPRVLVRTYDSELRLLTGSSVSAGGLLLMMGRSRSADLEDNSYRFYRAMGVSAVLFCDHSSLRILKQPGDLRSMVDHSRYHIIDMIYNGPLRGETADFLVAMLLGRDEFLNPAVRDDFRGLGIAHLLAVSGFHVAVFAGFFALVLYPLKLSRFGRYRHFFLIVAVWLYVALTGFSPSAVRAAILITIVLLGAMLQRAPSSYNSIAIAALIMLAINPLILYSPAFQLTFCAVLGLVAFASALNPFSFDRKGLRRVASLFIVPLAAMGGTCVVSLGCFHSFPLLFLLSNVVICCFAPLFILGGMILILSLSVGIEPVLIGHILDGLYAACMDVVNWLATLCSFRLDNIYLSNMTLCMLAVTVVLTAIALNHRRRWLGLLTAACLFMTVGSLGIVAAEPQSGELYVPSGCGHAAIVCRNGCDTAMLSLGNTAQNIQFYNNAPRKYARWMQGRGCRIVEPADSFSSGQCIYLAYDHLVCGSQVIAIVDGGNQAVIPLADYCLVNGRGVSLDSMASHHPHISLILSPGLSKADAQDYTSSAYRLGLKVHNAADSTFALKW